MRLHRIPLLLLMPIAVSLVVAACGGASATATPTNPSTTGATAAPATATARPTTAPPATATTVPQPTGQFRLAGQQIPGSGLLAGNQTFHYQIEPMYDELIGLDVNSKLDPNQGFITAWTISPDSKQWTFKSRTGVTFHNGDRASAADVKASLEWYINPDSGAGFAGRALILDHVDVPDETTSVAVLKAPSIFFTYLQLTSGGTPWSADFLIPGKALAEKGFKTLLQSPIGSGPYKFKSAVGVGNQNIEYEATGTPHFFYGLPKYKNFSIIIIEEAGTRLALVKTGGAEAAYLPTNSIPELRSAGFDIVAANYQKSAYISVADQFRTTLTGGGPNPFGDLRVRQALSLAVDRDLLVNKFMNGAAQPNVSFLSPRDLGYKLPYPMNPLPKQDLVQAKKLLADAGYTNFTIDMYLYVTNGLDAGPDMMEAIAVWWESLGLKVNRKPADVVNVVLPAYAKHDFSLPTVQGILSGFQQPLTAGSPAGVKGNIYRVTEDAEIDGLVKQLLTVSTPEDYNKTVQTLNERYVSQSINLYLFYWGDTYAIKSGLGGKDWNIGKKGISLNLNALLTGKGN